MTQFVTSAGPYLRNPLAQTKRAMRDYTIGLLGLFSFSTGFHWLTHGIEYGLKSIGMMVTSLLITLLADMFVAALRYQAKDGRLLPSIIHSIRKNYSYVTAVLMTLTLPIGTPYYVVIVGNLFATLIVKYTFGGFGMNIFNPAAFGRIFVGLAFGGQLTAYIPGTLGNYLGDVPSLTSTGQTITTAFASTYANWIGNSLEGLPVNSLWQLIFGNYSGALGETSVLLIVVLGVILTLLKAHNWRPTVFFLSTLWLGAFFLGLVHGLNPIWYAFTFVSLGSVFFGGMFMLTDPVTSPTSNYGKAMIGIIAAFVVLIIRTQTALPEGVVYGIALANLASPIIDKYTVGLTNQFLTQRYALLSGLMVLSIGVTILPTIVTADSSSSPSSSEVVVVPYATYRGEYSSYFYDEDDTPTNLVVDVGVDRSFNLVKIDIISGISTSGFAPTWASIGPSIIHTYLSMNVDELLAIDDQLIPENITITGSSITTSRLLKAMQQAFHNITIFKGSAQSYACNQCDTEDVVYAMVYVDTRDNMLVGLNWTGTLATSNPYLTIVTEELTGIQDFYLGQKTNEVIALTTLPIYPNFNPSESGATISFIRLHQALLNALGD